MPKTILVVLTFFNLSFVLSFNSCNQYKQPKWGDYNISVLRDIVQNFIKVFLNFFYDGPIKDACHSKTKQKLNFGGPITNSYLCYGFILVVGTFTLFRVSPNNKSVDTWYPPTQMIDGHSFNFLAIESGPSNPPTCSRNEERGGGGKM
jgi:hypothetical protein